MAGSATGLCVKYPDYPETTGQANHILDLVRAGCGEHLTLHLIRYCLLMTGDLV